MTFLEDRDLEDVPTIPEYYRGKTVFITGGTGFMGKNLIEKLLYSCTDLHRIYVLVRTKKGVKPEYRLADIFASSCFDRLREERPGVFESKVFFIAGDSSKLGLGLSEEDRALLVNQTNIIYNAAASVRFDDPLKVSVNLNLRSTIEIIALAKEVKNLESFIHVSTSYCNSNHDPVEEIIYPPHTNWRDALEICENIDDHTLSVLTPKYLGKMPNTYVFVKQLAENVVYEHKGNLPLVIVRPSIVVASYREPMPGWIDNFNGPVGLIVASGKGILRTLYGDPDITGDFIPVDLAIKGFIAASWIRGTKKLEPTDDIPIYNVCNGSKAFLIYSKNILSYGLKIIESFPLNDMVWSAGGTISKTKIIYFIRVLFLHVLPAMLLDSLLWIFGKKTKVIKIQRRIYIANLAIAYYLTQQWTFSNENFLYLRSKIKEEDHKQFFYVMENIDMLNDYYKNSVIGARRYLLNEKDDTLPQARVHYRRINISANVVKYLFYGCLLWWIIHTDFVRTVFDKGFNYK